MGSEQRAAWEDQSNSLFLKPIHLHTSEVYLSFSKTDEDNEIFVPKDCLKPDLSLTSVHDAVKLLPTMRFWVLNASPKSVIAYFLNFWDGRLRRLFEKYELQLGEVY